MYHTPNERKHMLHVRLFILLVLVVILLFIGTFVYHFLEDWTYTEALYFSAISLMTRGISELMPTKVSSILFSVVYLFIGVCFIIYSISTVMGYYVAFYQESIEKRANKVIDHITKKKEKKKSNEGWVAWK